MSTDKYSKHQKSRFKRFVATMPDGTKFQADTNHEIKILIKEYQDKNDPGVKSEEGPLSEEIKVPKFDPFTGEPL